MPKVVIIELTPWLTSCTVYCDYLLYTTYVQLVWQISTTLLYHWRQTI